MTKTIKEVLEELWWHGERYGTGTVGKDELSKEEALNQALSEIEKIMDGVIGGDETPPIGEMGAYDPKTRTNELITDSPAVRYHIQRVNNQNSLRTDQRQSFKEVLGE